MPKNKDALIRFRIINNCLLKGQLRTKEEIIQQIQATLGTEISTRTFAEDIKNMREDEALGYLAPIVFDKINKGYCYSDKNYSIDNIPLNAEEIEALSFAASLLDQYKRIEIFEKFTGAVDKIVDLVKIRRKMESNQVEQYVEFESAPLIVGSNHIEPLANAIRQKKVLKIHYQSFNSEKAKNYTIHPFYLKEYRNRWYLIGQEEEKQAVITLGLERILELTELPNVTFTSTTFNPKQYFGNSIGISVSNHNTTPEEIIIQYSNPLNLYIKTQPIHSSQTLVSEEETNCVMKYSLCPNYELKSMLLLSLIHI